MTPSMPLFQAGRNKAIVVGPVIVLAVLLPGCAATVPERAATPSQYLAGYDDGFAIGKQIGRQQTFDELRNADAFRVTQYQLSKCRDEVSWLTRGTVTQDNLYAARQRNLELLQQCRDRNDAKVPVIYRMIDRIRRAR